MGKKGKLAVICACMLLAVLFGQGVAGIQRAGEKAAELRYPLSELETVNLSRTGDSITVGEDPQIILSPINTYVKEIFLESFDTAEELQIFYTDAAGEPFSEEKSIYVFPEMKTGNSTETGNAAGQGRSGRSGAFVSLERNAAALRIDFNGAVGSSYRLSAVVLNPVRTAAGNFRMVLVSVLLGGLAGLSIVVFAAERRNLRIYLGAFRKYHYLLEDMVARDIKLKYRRSIIGFFWSILNPLLMMCVITAVFQNLFRMNVDNFAVYYLTGWCVFNFVTEATSGAMTSILNSGALIRKVYIPKYIFPMQKCVFSFVNMLFSLAALLVVMLVLRVGFTWRLLLIPVPLLLALVFSVGLGMILATAAVFFRDVIHLYTVFTMVWMYLTPIIYPMEILSEAMFNIVKMNPLYYYVDSFRRLVLYHTVPDAAEIGIMAAWALGSMLVGAVVFKKKQDRFILFI